MKNTSNNKCKKCGYEWISRVKLPRQCPNCKRQIKYLANGRTDKEQSKIRDEIFNK